MSKKNYNNNNLREKNLWNINGLYSIQCPTHGRKNNSPNPLWAKQACRHTKQHKSRQRQRCFHLGL